MDPLLDLIRLLRPEAAIWGRTRAGGRWGHYFHARESLLFGWVQRGECLLLREGRPPVRLATDDVFLIWTAAPFALASDAEARQVDSETPEAGGVLGDGPGNPVIVRGGSFVVSRDHKRLFGELLPQLIHLDAGGRHASTIRTLLEIGDRECRQPGPGADLIVARLVEIVILEAIRGHAARAAREAPGLLAGLNDPGVSKALVAMHERPARAWTVSELATLCGASRSSFASRFTRVVGSGPIDYLVSWRMAVARDRLADPSARVGEIAFETGYQSSSAFSKAFSREVGTSPRAYAERHGRAGGARR